jgi:hypothetical protein
MVTTIFMVCVTTITFTFSGIQAITVCKEIQYDNSVTNYSSEHEVNYEFIRPDEKLRVQY